MSQTTRQQRLEQLLELAKQAEECKFQVKQLMNEHYPVANPSLEDRLTALETYFAQLTYQTKPLQKAIEDLTARLDDRVADQLKSFDQMFASLGRDSHKLAADQTIMQDRLTRLESGMVRAIGILQSSEGGIADFSNLRDRYLELESSFQRVLKAVESLQRTPEPTDTTAERETTASVLASLTKLVQGMRAEQNERQASMRESV